MLRILLIKNCTLLVFFPKIGYIVSKIDIFI